MSTQSLTYDSRDGTYRGTQSDGTRIIVDGDVYAEARQQRERDGMLYDQADVETADPDGWYPGEHEGCRVATWGGRREGSGRRKLPDEVRKAKISIAIEPGTRAWLEQLRQEGETLGEVIDRLGSQRDNL